MSHNRKTGEHQVLGERDTRTDAARLIEVERRRLRALGYDAQRLSYVDGTQTEDDDTKSYGYLCINLEDAKAPVYEMYVQVMEG